jgi:hypothetical protein
MLSIRRIMVFAGVATCAAAFALVLIRSTTSYVLPEVTSPTKVADPTPYASAKNRLKTVNACTEQLATAPATWSQVEVPPTFAVALPPTCQRREAEETDLPHGGMRFRCGRIRAQVLWGQWDAGSFEGHALCRSSIGGVPVIHGHVNGSAMTWYLTGLPVEPVVGASSREPADANTLARIANSGVVRPH